MAKKEQSKSFPTEEIVEMIIPRLRDGKEEDWIGGLNGVIYRIKRGVKVRVPLGLKEIYDNSEEMQTIAEDRAARKASRD